MKISIVITSYNYAKYIKDSIQSVLNQTYTDWELVIIDDGSNDNSLDIIKNFDDKRIKLIVNDKNIGLTKSLKKAIDKTSGDWIAFLESDDLWTDNYLEEKVKIIEKYPDIALIFNDVEMFGDKDLYTKMDKFSKKFIDRTKSFNYPKNIFSEIIKFNSVLTFSTALINKSKLIECTFDTNIDRQFDWKLFINLSRNNEFYYIPQKLTKWRFHKDSYIHKKKSFFTLPVNFLTLWDMVLKEKSLGLFFKLLSIIPVCIAKRLH